MLLKMVPSEITSFSKQFFPISWSGLTNPQKHFSLLLVLYSKFLYILQQRKHPFKTSEVLGKGKKANKNGEKLGILPRKILN